MLKSRRIGFDTHGPLKCPRCGNSYLHQKDVQVFHRLEDDPVVRVITVKDGEVESIPFPNNDTFNPSTRRHGMIVFFYCENCGPENGSADLYMTIAQHKGETLMEWRF